MNGLSDRELFNAESPGTDLLYVICEHLHPSAPCSGLGIWEDGASGRKGVCRENKITENSLEGKKPYKKPQGISARRIIFTTAIDATLVIGILMFKPRRVSEKSLYKTLTTLFQFGNS